MLDCLRRLVWQVWEDWATNTVTVDRDASFLPVDPIDFVPNSTADLFVANSGTTMRFLCALVSLGEGEYRLDGTSRMRERPIQDLLDALGQLGVYARSDKANGCPPVTIRANGLRGGHVR